MPFGNYKDFADCVKQNQDKDNPEAFCGKIQSQVEGKDNNDSRLYKRVERLPLAKSYKDSDKKQHIAAYISSTLRDRDGDRFDKTVLEYWAKLINAGKINLGQDHGHSWKDTMGVWKHAEVRHNPNGDDIKQAKWYLYADAVLEDPEVNKDSGLLIHKSDIGEQISLSIAANPVAEKWFDKEMDPDGVPVRVIKSAELLQADIVGEPANPEARSLGTFLKHLKEQGCGEDCIVCQFDNCVTKSKVAAAFNVEQIIVSSLVTEKESKAIMTEPVKKSQEELNKEHGCKEGETYCDKEGKCMPDEPTKSQLSPEVEKFIETLKTAATAPQTGDKLELLVQQVLASLKAVPAVQVQPQVDIIPTAQNLVTPSLAPTVAEPVVAPEIVNPAPIPEVQVQASTKEPQIKKEYIKTVLVDKNKLIDYLEKARKEVTPKQENPGEILPTVIDTTKLEPELRKAAEEYNKKVYELHASQVKQQYTPNDIAKMSAEGKLVKELDVNNNFDKTVRVIAKSKSSQKPIGSLLLQKAA